MLKFSQNFIQRLNANALGVALVNKSGQSLADAATTLLASPMASTSPPVKTVSVQIVKLIGAPQTRKPPTAIDSS